MQGRKRSAISQEEGERDIYRAGGRNGKKRRICKCMKESGEKGKPCGNWMSVKWEAQNSWIHIWLWEVFHTHIHITHMCDTGSVIIDKARAEAVHTKRYFQLRWMSSLYGVCLHYVSYSNNIKNQLGIWCISQKRARVKCLDVSFAFCAVECAYYGILFEVINQYIANAYILQFNWNSGCWVKNSIPPASYELSSLFTDFHRNITFVLQLYSSFLALFQFSICICSVYFMLFSMAHFISFSKQMLVHVSLITVETGMQRRTENWIERRWMVSHFRSRNFLVVCVEVR